MFSNFQVRKSYNVRPSRASKLYGQGKPANIENLKKNYKSERTEELKEIFRMYDKTNVGSINQTTLKFLLRGFGQYVDEVELCRKLKLMDEDGNGTIDFQQFLKYMMEQVNNERLVDDLVDVFRIFDKENLNCISPIRLKAITYGQVDINAIDELLGMADSDDEGEINYISYLEDLFEDPTDNNKKKIVQKKSYRDK